MAKDKTGFTKLIEKGLNPETLKFIKSIKQTLDQPAGDGGTAPVQPADRFSGPLAKYEDVLPAIQKDLERLSSALALWLGTAGTAEPGTSKTTDALAAGETTWAFGAPAATAKVAGQEAVKPQPTSINDFLASVGKAVITAQGELDKSLAGPDKASLSAAYRIPKLSAEIAFEVETADTSGINILLASREKEERESLRQKVSFDIVATPLPAELSARNQLAAIIFNRLDSGDPWRQRLAGATLVRAERGTLALWLDADGGPALLIAPDDVSKPVQGALKLDDALGKAFKSVTGPG